MAKGNKSKEQKNAKGAASDASQKVSTEPVATEDASENAEVWDIIGVISKGENRTCRTEKCQDLAVATWASNLDPDDTWDLCEKCQEKDFGGWPEGFHPDDSAPESEDDPNEKVSLLDGSNSTDEQGDETQSDVAESDAHTVEDGTSNVTAKDDGNTGTVPAQDQDGSNEEQPTAPEDTKADDHEGSTDSTSHDDSDDFKPDETGEGSDEDAEMWDLKKILPLANISKECPVKCSTSECPLAACSVWVSSLAPTDKWYSCMDCQEKDFDGWPVPEELPVTHITVEHKRVMAEKCSSQKAPSFPDLPTSDGASPKRGTSEKQASSHVITPPPSSAVSMQAHKKGGNSTVTPSPATEGARSLKENEKKWSEIHQKWQKLAEALGGPGTRIVVKKEVAKKLVFDMLHDSFCPMNITQIHNKLKGVVPSPVLRSCLDDMALDKVEDGKQFTESDSEDEEKKKRKEKKDDTSDAPYAGSLCLKAGRNANNCLYYVDHTRLKNNGNGLEPEDRNTLAAGIAQTESEEAKLKDEIQRIASETKQLLSEPTNEEAAASLETEEARATENADKLEAARKLKVNEKHKLQTKKRIDSMTAVWRKRKRMCMDFLISMEECTDGAVSVKKCLSGDGQIEIDSDEAVCDGAIAFHKRKRLRTGKAALGRKTVKLTGKKQSRTEVSKGIPPTESFIGVKLDARGNVCRVHVDGDECIEEVKKARVSDC